MVCRNRTPLEYVGYGLYLYFSGLSLRKASERLACFVKRNHVSIWNWIQKYNPQKIASWKKKADGFVVDETVIKVGSESIWLWVAIESETKNIVAINISKERNMFVASRGFYITLQKTMANIRFQQTVVLGIHLKPASF